MSTENEKPRARRASPWAIVGLVLLTVALSVGITLWLVFALFFPSQFEPVRLDQKEEQTLERKLDRLERGSIRPGSGERAPTPEPYSESGASREIELTEKEVNALLARNTNLAHRLAIDLSGNLASAKLLVPLDPDLPLFGGKTLKVTAGLEMRYAEGRPVIILKGVSVWGVPLPNAWLGDMKNIDLVKAYGTDRGFWQAFSEGVEKIEVEEGKLRIRLKE
jgi:cell division septal protein FtsQ